MTYWPEEFNKAYSNYLDALNKKDETNTECLKYKLLWTASNFFEVVISYIGAYDLGIKYDFGRVKISKGTRLYRIRRYEKNTDFSNHQQWSPPPSKPCNRANYQGQEALYLASSEEICILETHIQNNEKYVLGTYEVLEDITVGGFYGRKHKLHDLAATVLNAFLIAPSRNEYNKDIFDFLDKKFTGFTVDDLSYMKRLEQGNDLILPLHFAVTNKGNEYYKLTNQICKIVSEQYPEGIRYSSCYMPLDTVGLLFNVFNVVLYRDGISKIKFLNYEIKTKTSPINSLDILKRIAEQEYANE